KRAYCLKTQPATGETYPKSDLFNKAPQPLPRLDPSVVCQPSTRRPGDERCLRRGPYVMLDAAGALIILINQEGKL
ncbi:hypothetical protein, partial [Klebsiella quasipneumoniae]|uniref:hypothetical protein n=1 Tax=Klebsiella quasipneumoniae TaxID=1463165 RepID=UPI001BAFC0A7